MKSWQRTNLQNAKRLVGEGKYNQARHLLEKTKHPQAEKWLAQLNEKHPPRKSFIPNIPVTSRQVKFAIILLCLTVIVTFLILDNNRANRNANRVQTDLRSAQEYCQNFGYTGVEFDDCVRRRMD